MSDNIEDFKPLLPDKSVEERMDSFPSFKITKQEDAESHILYKRYPDEFEYEVSKRRFKSDENTRSIDFCTPTLFSSDLFGASSFGRRVASLVGESLLIPDEKKRTEINHQLPQRNEVRRGERWIGRHNCHASGSSASGSFSTELHTSSRRPDMKSFMFSELQGMRSFSKVFFQEQTENSELLLSENEGSKISAKSMFVYSERRQDCKKDDKESTAFGHFHLQMLTREVDERSIDEYPFGTNSMESNGFCPMNSSKGFTSSKSNKHPLMLESNRKICKDISDSQIEQQSVSRNPRMKFLDPKMKQACCLNKMVHTESVEVNTTAKMCPDKTKVASNVKRLETSYSHNPLENAKEPEPSNRWIKRLKLQQMDPFALGTKYFTMDDASSSRRAHKLLTRVLNYSRSNSDFTIANHLEEEQQPIITSVQESPVESLKNSYSWISRWCRKKQNQNAGPSKIMSDRNSTCPKPEMQVLSESETPELNENSTSIQFPSMAALALIGKAISNFKPCEFRKRGTSLVWDTEIQLR